MRHITEPGEPHTLSTGHDRTACATSVARPAVAVTDRPSTPGARHAQHRHSLARMSATRCSMRHGRSWARA